MAMQLDLPSALKASVESSEHKQLGKSGLRVSVPIFGTMSVGRSKWSEWVKDDEQALPLLKVAYVRGINSWDTAGLYSNGGAEEMIGKAIRKYDIPKHKLDVFIIPYWGDLTKSKDYVNQFGLSRQAIFDSVESSLKRIGTDYLDLLMVHRVDPTVPIEETVEALHDLVKSGKVRYIGASSMWTYQFAMMQFCAERNDWTKFICMQNLYNLLYREEEGEMNKYCNETGVGIIPWAPLSSGYLTRPASDKDATVRGRTDVLKRDLDVQEKRISSPAHGFSSVKLMEEALAIRDQNLTEAEEQYLEEPYQPRVIVGHS
ncbi:hypothetical protein ACJ73_07777 [Blastomyces percursus]|uniref:NADP-dependent oxidoreductase domain-containing protein n=1 Tax=Blastomyces percursus TaxID=1658174 RepID=A0A1J9PX12_9EURO|nr:hypothetical protein ACJ73_07777 [Blastomyces percursus]